MEKKPQNFNKGLFTDTNEEFQPEGTYRFMLNGVLESKLGEKGSVINELGTDLCFDINTDYPDYSLIGACLLSDNRVVLFLTNNTVSIIGIQNTNCEFEELIVSECLGFVDYKPIDCIFKLHNGCDYYLYFTDNFNKYRSININSLGQYTLDSYNINDLNTGSAADPNFPTLGNYGWDCSLMAINPDFNIPDIYLNKITKGGTLKIGAYQFTFRYLDEDLNPTGWVYLTNPVYITKNTTIDEDLAYNNGGYLGNPDQDGFEYSNKAIELEIINIDTRYKYYQIGVLESAQGTGNINAAYISNEVSISGNTAFYKLTDLTVSSGITTTDPAEITVPNLFINLVGSHTQVENKLLLANITDKVTDWSSFQREANNIQTEYFTYDGDLTPEIQSGDCEYSLTSVDDSNYFTGKNYSKPVVSYDNKSYMRDEIYALGIVWVFKDGTESPVLHIPGRNAIGDPTDPNSPTGTTSSITLNGTVYDSSVGFSYWANDIKDTYNITNGNDEWDTRSYIYGSSSSTDIIYVGSGTDPSSGSIQYEPTEIANCENIYTFGGCNDPDTELLRWKHVNTSIKCPDSDLTSKIAEFNSDNYKHNFTVQELGIMGYYETDTSYPDIKDCNGVPIFPHIDNGDGTYRMHNIRHHLMPDARKVHITEHANTPGVSGYSIRDAEKILQILPLGVRFHNISIPTGFENEVQGYYIVRSDRAGNKTVVDKGWMNVCDTTIGSDDDAPTNYGRLPEDYRTIEQNPFFMTPTQKNGMMPSTAPDEFTKQPWEHGYNIVEFFSPKSSFNDTVNLAADYYKLENTVYGKFSFHDELNDLGRTEVYEGTTEKKWISDVGTSTTNDKYRLHMYCSLLYNELPRTYNYSNRNDFYLYHKLPIDNSEYTSYDSNTQSLIVQSFTTTNDNHRQRIMLSKLFYESPELSGLESGCWFHKPKHTAVYNLLNGAIVSGVEDIIPTRSVAGNPVGSIEGTDNANIWDIGDWIEEGQTSGTPSYPTIGEQFIDASPINLSKDRYSPFIYYAALKQNIIPYRKLESITYVRTTNYIIPANKTRYAVSGGDTFIARQQLFKSFYKKNSDTDHEYGGSLMYGYVESEINSQFRHKEFTDDYRVYPWDSLDQTVYTQVHELKLNTDGESVLRESAEHLYRYRLDYSKDNNDRIYPALPDQFEYCSDCSGRFPHSVYYSLTSFPDDTQDFYRIFKANNARQIPSDSGEISNLILKEENLFVHTTNNMFRFNVAPQQLKTNNDTIQVGQGEFLSTRPTKLFDNSQGYSRGGTRFKFSGVLTDLSYIWIDNISGRVYSLNKGVEEISLKGMKRFFKNNSVLFLNEQFKNLTGTDYPYIATTSGRSIGFRGVYDPEHERYILHKRDFRILDSITPLELPSSPPYVVGQLYYDLNGFYVGGTTTTLININTLDGAREYFETKSYTISYSLLDQAWVSFHSYLPSMMYNNSDTFFSYYSNNSNLIGKTWKHNDTNFTTYADSKFPFIIDYVSNKSPYQEKSYDTIEYTSNVYLESAVDNSWIEVPFVTFQSGFVYNNNQISNIKSIEVSNLNPYDHISYNVNISKAKKVRNHWRINRFRDMAVNRLNVNEPLFTSDWNNTEYSNQFGVGGLGWIDKVINPDIIDLSKNPYTQQRFTDKYFGTRLFFGPAENYKIVMNIGTSSTRNKK